ncbi:garL, partial [Symbiodinium sp. KB8]
ARAVACVAQLSGAITTELIAQAGFELIIVDHENGPGDFFSAANLVRSSVGAGAHCILRLPCAEHSQVYRALDAGAEGLLLPQVQSRGEAEAFGALVRKVSERTRDDEYLEWRSSPLPPPEAAGGDEDPIPVPRPLVAVEMDPSCTIDVAEELLKVEGVDLVFVDPERCLAAGS